MYKRVLIKLSGQALGLKGVLFDFEKFNQVAKAVVELRENGVEVALVLGGGNIWRGRQGPTTNMDPVTADHMGMLGTAINSLAMQDALERAGQQARVLSAIQMTAFAEPYIRRRAVRHLEKGRVVLFACGTGNPFFSTDTAAALRAVEIGAEAVLLAKSIDGVYADDPIANPSAEFIPDITYKEALDKGLRVMDTAALAVCDENKVPAVHVFSLDDPTNIVRVAMGEAMGSLAHP